MKVMVVPSAALLLLLCAPGSALAQAGRALDSSLDVDPRARTRAEDPEAVADLGAARAYLEGRVRPDDPARYARLDPALSRLESLNDAADGVAWAAGSMTAGTLAVAIGLAAAEDEEPAAALFAVSGGLLVVGLLIQAFFRPGPNDVLDVFRVPR